MKKKLCVAASIVLFALISSGQKSGEFKPLLTKPGEVVLHEDFDTPHPLEKKVWQNKQGTRWEIKDGELQGLPSTPEYQASKKDHKGFDPRLGLLAVPQEYAIQFSFKLDPKPTAAKPKLTDLPTAFFEFGHHMTRLLLDGKGAHLLVDHESTTLTEDTAFRFEPGRWYQFFFELKGDEVVLQIQDSPTLRGKHEIIAQEKDGFNFVGTGSMLHIDNLIVWSVQ